MTRSLAQINSALTKAGYPNLRYRLYKVSGNQQGQFTHLWEASWSGRAEYDRVHNLPVYKETNALLKELEPLMKKQGSVTLRHRDPLFRVLLPGAVAVSREGSYETSKVFSFARRIDYLMRCAIGEVFSASCFEVSRFCPPPRAYRRRETSAR
jgi:hypothetical protein